MISDKIVSVIRDDIFGRMVNRVTFLWRWFAVAVSSRILDDIFGRLVFSGKW